MSYLVFLLLVPLAALALIKRNKKQALNTPSYIIDGDTVDINGVRIRLYGIDAPEMKQDGGEEAKIYLTKLLTDAQIEGRFHGKDVYDRTLATLYADGQDVCEAMVTYGYALANGRAGLYKKHERKARRSKKGLWAKNGISSPKAFRATA